MSDDRVAELSSRLAERTRAAAESVVRVEARGAPASGVVWSADGVVVAAHHAVEWDDALEVGLPGGAVVPATLVGRDPATDLALIRADATGLVPAAFGGGPPEAGQLALGVGRPGASPRASLGVVARVAGEWRAPSGGRLDRYVEVSLPLQPGLSGSLVVGATGGAIGVATAGLLRGLALAVPPATLRRVVEGILAHGRVRRGYLGIATVPVRLPPAAAAAAGQATALLVTAVEQESPADRGGVLLGDALVALGGARCAEPGDLLGALEEERIGEPLAVRALRAGAPVDLAVVVGTREGRRAGR